MRLTRPDPARGAFTLVELLVVLGIMLVLMSLAVVMATSGILDNHRLSAGSDRVSGWLLQARAKAFRDRLPRGIRFVPNAQGFVTEAQFIEVPEAYVPNPNANDNGLRLVLSYRQQIGPGGPYQVVKEAYIIGPIAELASAFNEVANGDTLKLASFTTLHRITGLTPIPNLSVQWNGMPTTMQALQINFLPTVKLPDLGPFTVQEQPTPPAPGDTRNLQYITTQFSFLRQARPMLGEQPLKLSSNTIIDFSVVPYPIPGPPPSTGYLYHSICNLNVLSGGYDVLFSPNGELLNSSGNVILWVRRDDLSTIVPAVRGGGLPQAPSPVPTELRSRYENAGEMAMITVYSKTGAVATHPVKLPERDEVYSDPTAFTKDGIASGL